MAESLKFKPRTKHITIKYHNFRSKVKTTYNISGDIIIKYISTKKQLSDIFNKPVDDVTLFTLRRLLCGWLIVMLLSRFRGILRNLSSYVRTDEFKFLSTYSTHILKLYGFHSYTVCIVLCIVLCVRTSRINKDSRLTI